MLLTGPEERNGSQVVSRATFVVKARGVRFTSPLLKLTHLYLRHQIVQNYVKLGSEAVI